MSQVFAVAGADKVDLDDLANQLRVDIDGLPSGSPQLKAKFLNQQTGVQSYLVVVRRNEDPHTHPEGDLIISVLQGVGYVQLLTEKVETPAGSITVIPKGVCHAYYNLAKDDSVILATFSPINSKSDCPLIV